MYQIYFSICIIFLYCIILVALGHEHLNMAGDLFILTKSLFIGKVKLWRGRGRQTARVTYPQASSSNGHHGGTKPEARNSVWVSYRHQGPSTWATANFSGTSPWSCIGNRAAGLKLLLHDGMLACKQWMNVCGATKLALNKRSAL